MANYTWTGAGGISFAGAFSTFFTKMRGILSCWGDITDIDVYRSAAAAGVNNITFVGSVGCTDFYVANPIIASKGILPRRRRQFFDLPEMDKELNRMDPNKMTYKQFVRWREQNEMRR